MICEKYQDDRRGSVGIEIEVTRTDDSRKRRECRVLLVPEEDGRFSAHALRLPGVVSEGDTIEEAIENISDAFKSAIAVYEEIGETIPWGDVEVDNREDALERWIVVDV